MKANELRIGNWVTEEERLVHIHDGFGIDHAQNFSPIPLTEEWLRRFGFKKDLTGKDFYFKFYGVVGIMHFSNAVNSTSDGGWYNYEPIIGARHGEQFKYVHQLQNLYFALTGEELTVKK